ncbi:MAG: hypothetical protein IJ879_05205 [Muribaculaceae bacterium]|nr:hypothetical protein [Muribaculaceae bacterium]
MMGINDILVSSAEKLITQMIDAQARNLIPKNIVDVVIKHSQLAAGTGLIPVPGADLVMGTANTVKMFKDINSVLGIDNNGIALKTIASTMLTSLTSRLTSAGISSSLKFIPGVGQVAGALISSVMQYLIEIMSGHVYFNALSLIVDDKGHVTMAKLGDAMKKTLANKEVVDTMFDAIKANASQTLIMVKENVGSWTGSALEGISSVAESTKSGAANLLKSTKEGSAAVAESVKTGASGLLKSTKEGSAAVLDSVGKWINSLGKSVSGLWGKKKTQKED